MVKQKLYDYLFDINPLPDELKNGMNRNEVIQLVNTQTRTSYHSHRVLLLTAGNISDHLYFIEKGVVRGYIYDQKKKEKTIWLWDENTIVTDVPSFIHRIPSEIYIETMPDTTLTTLSYNQLENIFISFPFLRPFLNTMAAQYTRYSNKRFYDLGLSAWERLEEIRLAYPKLEQKISKEIIASFLGITPQHLSRIIKVKR